LRFALARRGDETTTRRVFHDAPSALLTKNTKLTSKATKPGLNIGGFHR